MSLPFEQVPWGNRSYHQEAGGGSEAHHQRLDSFWGFHRNLESIVFSAKLAKIGTTSHEESRQTLSAIDVKYGFGRLIDLARAKPIAVAKHGRPVVVVLSVEEYERLKALERAGEKDQSAGKADSK